MASGRSYKTQRLEVCVNFPAIYLFRLMPIWRAEHNASVAAISFAGGVSIATWAGATGMIAGAAFYCGPIAADGQGADPFALFASPRYTDGHAALPGATL